MESPRSTQNGDQGRNPVQSAYTALLAELRRADRTFRAGRLRVRLLRVAGLLVPTIGLLLVLNVAFADITVHLSRGAALALVAALGAAVAVSVGLARGRSHRDMARLIERRDRRVGRDVLSVVDLWDLRAGERGHWYSRELLDSAISQRVHRLSGVRFDEAVRVTVPRRWSLLAMTGVLIAAVGILLSPPAAGRMVRGVVTFGADTGAPRDLAIQVSPGDCRVLAGDALTLRARVAGQIDAATQPDADERGLWIEVLGAAGAEDIARRINMRADAGEEYVYTFARVMRPFDYRVRGDDASSAVHRVELTERPRLAGLSLVYNYPEYTREPTRRVEQSNGRIVALRGTRVEVRVESSVALAEARLDFDEGNDPVPMRVVSPVADSGPATRAAETSAGRSPPAEPGPVEARGTFEITENTGYSVWLRSIDGHDALPGDVYPVVALADEDPYVRLLRPAADVTLGRDLGLRLGISAVDDYGLGALTLHYRVALAGARADDPEETGSEMLSEPGTGAERRRELRLDHDWDLSMLDLGPGDVVSYWITVFDNDVISGPKQASTPVFQARFPTLEEVYAEVSDMQEEQRETLEEIAAEERELKEKLEELSREALRDQDMEWEERQELEQALARQEEIQKQMQEVIDSLNDAAEEFEQRDLLGPEAVSPRCCSRCRRCRSRCHRR